MTMFCWVGNLMAVMEIFRDEKMQGISGGSPSSCKRISEKLKEGVSSIKINYTNFSDGMKKENKEWIVEETFSIEVVVHERGYCWEGLVMIYKRWK